MTYQKKQAFNFFQNAFTKEVVDKTAIVNAFMLKYVNDIKKFKL